MATEGQLVGAMLGLALGDALGAPYEGGWLERAVWGLIGRTRGGARRWTDDTQMALDLAESLAARGAVDPDALAARFARSYRYSRGYGPGAAKVLKRIRRGQPWEAASRSVYPDGSYGNGAAMRAPVIGLFFGPEDLAEAARASAVITHAHPLGVQGAVLLASVTARALGRATGADLLRAASAIELDAPFQERLGRAQGWMDGAVTPGPRRIAAELGHGIAAAESCVTAVYLAAAYLDRGFLELLDVVRKVGGDVDTIGAMAGAVWGAARGVEALPQPALADLEQRERIARVAAALYGTRTRRPEPQ